MRFSFVQRAQEHEHFSPDAFDAQIGKRVPFRVDGADSGTAVLVAANVSADGSAVELTMETAA